MSDSLGTRRQQAEERREQILNAALEVFAEKGYAGASMRDIARAVGVTEGLLYHYFESKEQLLEACWRERSWRPQLERILQEGEDKPLSEVLREVVRSFAQTMEENASTVLMCVSEMQRNPQMAVSHIERIEDNMRLIGDFLRRRQAAGEIRTDIDVGIAAGMLLGSAYSAFLLWGNHASNTFRQMITTLIGDGVEVVMRGITLLPEAKEKV